MLDLATAKPTSTWLDTVPANKHYPELKDGSETEVAIIGGGIVAIWTAWELAKKGVRSTILEKNTLASGDTAFTTAFLIRAPDTSAAGLKKRYGQEFLNRVFAATTEAQDRVKATIAEEGIDCELQKADSYNCSYQENDESLAAEWDAVGPADPKAKMVGAEEASKAFAPSKAAMVFTDEARYHVRKFLFGLMDRPLAKKYITIFEDSEVTDVETRKDKVLIHTNSGILKANKVVVATGMPHPAFKELQGLFSPRISFVIAAKVNGPMPFSDDLFWDTEEPYQYFRRFPGSNDTIILGGSDEAAGVAAPAPRAHDKLVEFAKRMLPGVTEISHKWSGSLFESEDGLPYIAEHPYYRGRVYVASGFGGNGMVFSALAGRLLSDLTTGKNNPIADLFDWQRTKAIIPKPAARPRHSPLEQNKIRFALIGGLSVLAIYLMSLFKTQTSVYTGDWTTGLATFVVLTIVAMVVVWLCGYQAKAMNDSASAATSFVKACAESALELGKPQRFNLNGRTIMVVKLADGVFAINNVCGHAGGPLNEGSMEQFVVECPWHGSKFDVRTGAVVAGPASKPQRTYETRVVNGNVEVKV